MLLCCVDRTYLSLVAAHFCLHLRAHAHNIHTQTRTHTHTRVLGGTMLASYPVYASPKRTPHKNTVHPDRCRRGTLREIPACTQHNHWRTRSSDTDSNTNRHRPIWKSSADKHTRDQSERQRERQSERLNETLA